MLKPILNKWQLGIELYRDYKYQDKNRKILRIYCLKFISLPYEGEDIQKKHYKGFWLYKEFKLK